MQKITSQENVSFTDHCVEISLPKADKRSGKQSGKRSDKRTIGQVRQTVRQTHRQMDRQTVRQTVRQMEIFNIKTKRINVHREKDSRYLRLVSSLEYSHMERAVKSDAAATKIIKASDENLSKAGLDGGGLNTPW